MSKCDPFENLLKHLHVRYLKRFLDILPPKMASQDSIRLTIAYFALNGLDLLKAVDKFESTNKEKMIEWVYSLQIIPEDEETKRSWKYCGFQGSGLLRFPEEYSKCPREYACSHIAMTYTGLAILLILGDDLSRVHRAAVIEGVRALQQDDGSYCSTLVGSENDIRFVYCAACICYMLNDWTGMDIERTVKYIRNSISYDFGIAQGPGRESHGGSTFCAIATLSLLGRLETALTSNQLEGLRRWALAKQVDGFQGRANKPVDTCYSFWVGATLKLLGAFNLINFEENRKYILSTQDALTGGFSKWVDTVPDPLHTCLGLAGLSLMDKDDLLPVHPALNISMRAYKHLLDVQNSWGDVPS